MYRLILSSLPLCKNGGTQLSLIIQSPFLMLASNAVVSAIECYLSLAFFYDFKFSQFKRI